MTTSDISVSQPIDSSLDLAALFVEAQRVFESQFLLERTIAASQTRILFVARDVVLKRRVVLRIHLRAGTRSRQWFERETELLAALDHRAIRAAYAGGYKGEWAYRVGKWIDGESL